VFVSPVEGICAAGPASLVLVPLRSWAGWFAWPCTPACSRAFLGEAVSAGFGTTRARQAWRAPKTQALSSEVIVGGDADAGVEVETLEDDGVGLRRRRRRTRTLIAGVVVHVVAYGYEGAPRERGLREGFGRGEQGLAMGFVTAWEVTKT